MAEDGRNTHLETAGAAATPTGSKATVAEGWFRLRGAAIPWVMPSGGRALRFRFSNAASGHGVETAVDTLDGRPVEPGEMYLDARLTFTPADDGGVHAGDVFQILFADRVVGQGAVTRVLR